MAPIKLTIHRIGSGSCSLTGKEGDGLHLSFDDGTVKESFLSWRGLRQLLSMKAGQEGRPAPMNGSPSMAAPAVGAATK